MLVALDRFVHIMLGVVLASALPFPASSQNAQSGTLTQSGKVDAIDYDFQAICEENKELKPKRSPKRQNFIGTDGEPPICTVTAVALRLANRSIVFPKRAFHDLANLHMQGVEIRRKDSMIIIGLSGGDGAATYFVRYFIREGRLIRREVEQRDAKERRKVIRTDYE